MHIQTCARVVSTSILYQLIITANNLPTQWLKTAITDYLSQPYELSRQFLSCLTRAVAVRAGMPGPSKSIPLTVWPWALAAAQGASVPPQTSHPREACLTPLYGVLKAAF